MRQVNSVGRRVKRLAGKVEGALYRQVAKGEPVLPWRKAHPASFTKWLARNEARPVAEFPFCWRMDERLQDPNFSPARVAVVVHVFYLELVDDLVQRLRHIPVPFDVYVTNASGVKLADERFLVGQAARSLVFDVENRGRDIFPLVQLVNAGLLDDYELVLKIHTKRSQWRAQHQQLAGDGAGWREKLLDSLLGSPSQVERILAAFAGNSSLGVVTAPGSLLGAEFWGGDEYLVRELAKRLQLEIDRDTLEFPAGSMYWIRGFLVQGLRALCLSTTDFDAEAGQVDATTAHAIERLMGIVTCEAGLKQATTDQLKAGNPQGFHRFDREAPRTPAARMVPFYFPQFHRVPENDQLWGKGFTEWTNVATSTPKFRGHNQPLIPSDLGFYDLERDEVRAAQAELTKWAGLAGFMYYYYWFAGKRVMHVPLQKLRAQMDLEQSYCLMWANENWTRTWDGRTEDVLIAQEYDRVPAADFIDEVRDFLVDPRYLRVDGRAVVAVYRCGQIPDFARVVETWRERARSYGLGELLVLAVEVAAEFDGLKGSAAEVGVDGSLGFPPHTLPWKPAPAHKLRVDPRFRGNLVSYAHLAQAAIEQAQQGAVAKSLRCPGVMVNFDNTARRPWNPDVWWGSNPYTFHRWLREAVRAVAARPPEERLVFINAWNEWAEAAVLEPTLRWGRTYLQAVRNVAFS